MATDRARNNALRRERSKQRRRLTAIQKDTAAEVARLLRLAEDRIKASLAGAPTEFQAFLLPQLQAAVRAALAEIETGAAAAVNAGAGRAWQAGIDQIDKPIEAGLALGGGPTVRLSAILPTIDTRQLEAMRVFLTDRMRDITTTMANRINSQIGLLAIGVETPSGAAAAVSQILKSGGADGGRRRAMTIIRTELGRAYSLAGQQRQAQAAEVLPGLKKQWRRSGKLRSRRGHDLADGQIRAVDEPFIVNGVALMFPRDPAGPAKETVNCGCTSLPVMERWEVMQPGRQPFSDREVAADPFKQDLAGSVFVA